MYDSVTNADQRPTFNCVYDLFIIISESNTNRIFQAFHDMYIRVAFLNDTRVCSYTIII